MYVDSTSGLVPIVSISTRDTKEEEKDISIKKVLTIIWSGLKSYVLLLFIKTTNSSQATETFLNSYRYL